MPDHLLLQALSAPSKDVSFPMIDSHIHLFAEPHLPTLAWYAPEGPLSKQHSVSDYIAANTGAPYPPHSTFRGFVFVETDRKSTVSEENGGWDQPIEELKFLSRIVMGRPVEGEGHGAEDARFCLAIVGWAPVPGGRRAMEKFEGRVKSAVGPETMRKITGWRYLVQDKPQGTMLTDDFIDSLRWMGEKGYAFDLGVDMRSGGLWQLAEASTMLSRVTAAVPMDQQVIVVINHMCKPDMRGAPYAPSLFDPDNDAFASWQRHVKPLAAYQNTYMKLSGAFSELPPVPTREELSRMGFWDRQALLLDTTEHAISWMREVVDMFDTDRVMFGSDWPVCNAAGGGNDEALKDWVAIVRAFAAGLPSRHAHAQLWGLTAAKVYKIQSV